MQVHPGTVQTHKDKRENTVTGIHVLKEQQSGEKCNFINWEIKEKNSKKVTFVT